MNRFDSLKELFLQKDATGSGIFSSLGLNAYNLEQEAKSLIPYLYPFINSIPRTTSTVGGPGVNWKAVLSVNPGFITLAEAQRNAATTFLEKDYQANFKSMGVEVPVSWFAQETGRGFQDNMAFAQFSGLNAFLTAQEKKVLYGNSGPASAGGNGYALVTANTPVATLLTDVSYPGGSLPGGPISFRVVAITPYGMTVQNGIVQGGTQAGLTPLQSATSQDGDTITASGGTSAISAGSNVVTASAGHRSVLAQVTAQLGAVGYAWYVDSTDTSNPSTANAVFAAITVTNSYTLQALPSSVNQVGNATGLDVDYSYDTNDFDGMMSWAYNWATPPAGYSAFSAYVRDFGGAPLTAVGDGTIEEFNALAAYQWNSFKLAIDKIWCGPNVAGTSGLIQEITKLVLSGTSGAGTGAYRIYEQNEPDGSIKGAKLVSQLRWPFSSQAVPKLVDVATHPWLPNGTILFQLKNNPYPQAAGRIPSAFEIHALRDTFSIVWPFTRLQTNLGVYNFLTCKNYIPHGFAVFQNVG